MTDDWEETTEDKFDRWWKEYSVDLDDDVKDNHEVYSVARDAFFAGHFEDRSITKPATCSVCKKVYTAEDLKQWEEACNYSNPPPPEMCWWCADRLEH